MAKKFKQGPFSIAMAGSYAAKSGMGTDEIMALLTDGEDHWYTAAEALDAGLIDEISDALPVAAQYKREAACRYQSFPNKGILTMPEKSPEPSVLEQSVHQAVHDGLQGKSMQRQQSEPKQEIDPEKIRAEAIRAETARRADIKSRFAGFADWEGVPQLMDACLDDPQCGANDAGEKLLAHLAKDIEPIQGRNFAAGEDSRDKFIRGATQALLARMGAAEHDRANPYRGMRLHEIARACLIPIRNNPACYNKGV